MVSMPEERMMASKPDTGPDTQEREEPGDNQPNPAGVSSDAPAEGADDVPGKQEGSPEG
jgi:hypothetical protein